ncbi:MAG: glycosyl transferase family 1 [Desulfurococcales archaeon ex4484_58]|nr:MAG: glycosyl transferase family 1 [Desulfurococcales archaeon ex4484_58]
MRVAFMSRWNATCGISLHAELIGRELKRRGFDVIVFAPTLESANKDWHHRPLDVVDEPWVYRIYVEATDEEYPFGGDIFEERILSEEYDILIVEGYQRLPVEKLARIIKKIKNRTKLILVVHTGFIRDLEPYMKIDWDAIVVFDERYINEMVRFFGERYVKKTVVIPYPHAIIDDVEPYRPDFAKDKLLFITYGRQPISEYLDYIRVLRRLYNEYDLVYWIIRSDNKIPFNEPWIMQEIGRPDIRTIYSYVMGSDIHLLPKGETRGVVVSSTIAQILYSGTPTIVPNTRYFETIPVDINGFGPVIKYMFGNTLDLYTKIKVLIEDNWLKKTISRKAREYALQYSDKKITDQFIDLMKRLSEEEEIVVRVLKKEYVVSNTN